MRFKEFKHWLEGFKACKGDDKWTQGDLERILYEIEHMIDDDARVTVPVKIEKEENPFKDIFKKENEKDWKKYVGPWVEPKVTLDEKGHYTTITCDVGDTSPRKFENKIVQRCY